MRMRHLAQLDRRARIRIVYWTCFLLLLFAVVYANTGCSQPVTEHSGMVCGKRFESAHTDTTYVTYYAGDVPYQTPVENEYPNRYYLSVATDNDESCHAFMTDVQVSKSVYDTAQIAETRLKYLR